MRPIELWSTKEQTPSLAKAKSQIRKAQKNMRKLLCFLNKWKIARQIKVSGKIRIERRAKPNSQQTTISAMMTSTTGSVQVEGRTAYIRREGESVLLSSPLYAKQQGQTSKGAAYQSAPVLVSVIVILLLASSSSSSASLKLSMYATWLRAAGY